MVITKRKPLSFNEANAMAVPLKMRKGIKNSSKLFNPILMVSEARMKSLGRCAYIVKQNTSTANIRRIGSFKMRRIFFSFTLQYKYHRSIFDKEISKFCYDKLVKMIQVINFYAQLRMQENSYCLGNKNLVKINIPTSRNS